MLAAIMVAVTFVAVVLDSAFMWPQAIKLARTRDIAGVSALTWMFGVVFSVAWAAYAAGIGLWALFGSNVACTMASVLALWAGTRSGWPARYAVIASFGVVVAVLLAVWVPVVVVSVLTVGAVIFAVPQFVAVLRARSVTGVSSVTWWLNIGVSAAWLSVGLYEGESGVIVANSASVAALICVVAALYVRRLRSR